MLPADHVPIVYEHSFDTLFNDLDSYNHVNTSRYLDYVVSARSHYLKNVLKTSLDDFKSKGLAVFVRKATTEFLRPVGPFERIHVRSWVCDVGNTSFEIAFEILSGDQTQRHSQGSMTIVWIDVKTGKPHAFPDWAHPYFFTLKPKQ